MAFGLLDQIAQRYVMPGHPILTAVALAVALAASQGCGGDDRGTALTFQTMAEPGSETYLLLEAMLAEFTKQHPDVRVRLTGDRLKLEYLLNEIIAQDVADVVEVDAGEVGFLAGRGAVRDLTADCSPLGPTLQRQAWSLGEITDEADAERVYAVPWAARPKLLLYNKAAFREAGLPDDAPPDTWEELIQVSEKLTRDIDGDGRPDSYGFALAGKRSPDLGHLFATCLAQFDVPLLQIREGRWTFNIDTESGWRVMTQFLLPLKKSAPPACVVTDEAAALEQFRSGLTAMVIAGPAGLHAGPDSDPDAVGVAYVPVPTYGLTRSDVEFRLVCIPAFVRGRRYETAMKLVKFIAGKVAQDIVARGLDGCRPVVSVHNEVLAGPDYADRRFAMFAGASGNAVPAVPAPVWQGKCAKDWIGGIQSILLDDPRGVDEVLTVSQEKGDEALSCLFTNIGHPSWTMRLGMIAAAAFVFAAISYAISRR